MAEIDTRDLVDLTRTLVDEPSENPPGSEAGVASILVERLQNSPIEFSIDVTEIEPDRPNVLARAGDPEHGRVLLSGHMDVVPADPTGWTGDPYSLHERDGRLIGRGVADMKGALAAKLLAAEAYLNGSEEPGEVILGFVVDEEHRGLGTRTLVEEGLTADAAIIGEPSELQVGVAQKGVVRYRISVAGKNAHAGTPDEGADAIRGLGRLLSALEELDDEVRTASTHPLLDPGTLTVTRVSGGVAPNVVADRAELVLDWRFHPGETIEATSFDRRLERLVDEVSLPAAVSVTIERDVFAPAVEIETDHPLVQEVQEAARSVGHRCEAIGFNAVTDSRFLIADAGIPTVLFGPGSIEEDAHTVDESIVIDDLLTTARVYRAVLDRLLG